MRRKKSDYQTVLTKIRQSRSFIMPNIGFQAQVHKLRQRDRLSDSDIAILKESIATLRKIQSEFVQDEVSLKRFDIMFKEKRAVAPKPAAKGDNDDHANSVPTQSETA